MRRTITIPDAGVTKPFPVTGRSIIVEKAERYPEEAALPLLGFDSGGEQYPIYPRSTYQYQENRPFQQIQITGTTDSEGDKITLISYRECLPSELNIVYSAQFRHPPGTAFTKSASDAVQELAEVDLVDADGNLPSKLYIAVSPLTTAEDGIKWSINADPAQGEETAGIRLLPEDGLLELVDISWMLAFRFIAQTATETPLVNFIPEY